MSTLKSPAVRLLCFLALIGAVVICALDHNALAEAGVEHRTLLGESDEMDRLARENSKLAELRATNEEVKNLRPKERELLRLRNEVGLLRAQAAEAAKLRAENQRLTALQSNRAAHDGADALPADFIPRSALADAGLGTPEAAVQTYFYAISQGDLKRMSQSTGTPQNNAVTKEEAEDLSRQARQELEGFPGFRIAEENRISPDEAQIGVQSTVGGAILSLHLTRTGNEWTVK